MPPKPRFTVCCILPTLNAGSGFSECLQGLKMQSLDYDLAIVDSSSDDGTFTLAKKYADVAVAISRADFDHGATRQMMVERLVGYDVYLFLTQDAILADSQAIEKLMAPFEDPGVGCVYGRQLPHADATLLAKHARYFNYPDVSNVHSLEDARTLGLKAAFISNSFAAYRADALKDVGGFPEKVILSEDMYVAASMLLKGWNVAYAADATCRHSHNYLLIQEFSRYFDIGVFHSRVPWIREKFGGAGKEGLKYVLSELHSLGMRNLHIWPSSLIRNLFKISGFRLGLLEGRIPLSLKRKFSMNKRYWK